MRLINHWSSLVYLTKYVKKVFPLVDKELERYKDFLSSCENNELKSQGLLSIKKKRFHALGGAIFSLYPGVQTLNIIRFITAFQTISDYLDNLCDNNGVVDEKAFRQLHLSMIDALSSDNYKNDYYLYYPFKNDGGYLNFLVDQCKIIISDLPDFINIKKECIKLTQLYIDLQSLKHLRIDEREKRIFEWADKNNPFPQDLLPWEFSAACGSTLGIFILVGLSSSNNKFDVKEVHDGYFPWICGLHILLDYYIDRQEDYKDGEMNFTFYYKNEKETVERLSFIIVQSLNKGKIQNNPLFHTMVVKGLLAMYLSDPKAYSLTPDNTKALLQIGGIDTLIMLKICLFLRRKNKL